MVEPSKELQLVFDKAISDARSLQHEYVTLEHIMFAMLCSENFYNVVQGYGADPEFVKANLEHYLKDKPDDIKTEEVKYKPKKTSSVERVLNRAFTQVLFSGRPEITLPDVMLSLLSEKKSMATYYLEEVGITKEKFAEYINSEFEAEYEDEEMSGAALKALRAFTTNLNDDVRKNKVDPVIGRDDEMESLALALGRRQKNNVLMVGDPGVGKTAIAEGLAYNIVNDNVLF